jgi:hypothetical protein
MNTDIVLLEKCKEHTHTYLARRQPTGNSERNTSSLSNNSLQSYNTRYHDTIEEAFDLWYTAARCDGLNVIIIIY